MFYIHIHLFIYLFFFFNLFFEGIMRFIYLQNHYTTFPHKNDIFDDDDDDDDDDDKLTH